MMDHLLPGVDALVELEHKTIVEKWGEGYNSPHEAYAVLLEEVQEAKENLVYMEDWLQAVWHAVREDNIKSMYANSLRVDYYARLLAAEAVQIAAVARRWRGGLHNDA